MCMMAHERQKTGIRCHCHVTLPKTNVAPENGWLEDDPFLLGWFPGRCELLVSRRVVFGGTPWYNLLSVPSLLLKAWPCAGQLCTCEAAFGGKNDDRISRTHCYCRIMKGLVLTWMSQEFSKWFVNGLQPTYKWDTVYWGYIPLSSLLLTSWDIQVGNLRTILATTPFIKEVLEA